jgi:hypothetical protein
MPLVGGRVYLREVGFAQQEPNLVLCFFRLSLQTVENDADELDARLTPGSMFFADGHLTT